MKTPYRWIPALLGLCLACASEPAFKVGSDEGVDTWTSDTADTSAEPDAIACGDGDPTVGPDMPELCDGKDNDCDGETDELACDDGDPCSIDICLGATGECINDSSGTDGLPCADENPCIVGSTCSGGECGGGAPKQCAPVDDCHDGGTCDVATGNCTEPNKPDSTPCDDGDACTTVDVCSGGSCIGTVPLDCADGNVCTTDGCDPATGCVHADNTESCDDGDACTTVDVCSAGSCVGSAPPDCDDGNVCTTDGCESAAGCVHTNNADSCDDGDACTTVDLCSGGSCVGTSAVSCSGEHHCDGGACVCGDLGEGCPPGFACTIGENPQTLAVHCLALSSNEVYVPAGTFWMGCNSAVDTECGSDEYDQHEVDVPAFVIDRTEVTAGEYKTCVLGGGCTVPSATGGVLGTYDPAGKQLHHINFVTWAQAAAFCSWRAGQQPGKGWRLCTESEWEKAARGGCALYAGDCAAAMPTYPWGNEAPSCTSPALAVFDPDGSSDGCGTGETWAAGSKGDGASPYGALDMAGNVWEWVEDWYHSHYDGAPVDGTAWLDPPGSVRVIRGGCFHNPPANLRVSFRYAYDPSFSFDFLGFRCCRPIP